MKMYSHLAWLAGIALIVVLLGSADISWAQEAAAAGEAAAGGTHDKTFIEVMKEGGPVMIFLVIASILVMTFTVEGFLKLNKRKLAPPALIARLRESVLGGNYQEAWSICQSNRCFVSSVLGAALERIGRGKDQTDFAVQEASLREGTLLKMNVTYLSVIGVVSPMIGLTGTVIGMIKAFSTLGASGIGNPQGLASAIGEVLVCTAAGLVVAIPAFVFFYILKSIATSAILVAESEVYHLLDEIPYDQISGLRIGENFNADAPAPAAPHDAAAATSQRVSRSMTTNCPQCNAAITPGTNPCPNCGVVLEWDN